VSFEPKENTREQSGINQRNHQIKAFLVQKVAYVKGISMATSMSPGVYVDTKVCNQFNHYHNKINKNDN
jgi:hypothetical protein